MKKLFKYVIILLGVVFIVLIYLGLSMDMRSSDEELIDYFSDHDINAEVHMTDGLRSIHIKSLSKTDHTVIFVHGAPGSADQFKTYLIDSTLRNHANLITLDRPGYGYSDYGRAMIDIPEQARVIESMILVHVDTTQNIVLVSHSYGGPICAVLSALIPDRIKSNLMLNPVIDPDSEKEFWFSGAPLWWPLRYISSGANKVAAHEKLNHASSLRNIEAYWDRLKVRTVHIQGDRDWLAPIENARFVQNNFNPELTEVIILNNTSHFIPFTRRTQIMQWIINEINL